MELKNLTYIYQSGRIKRLNKNLLVQVCQRGEALNWRLQKRFGEHPHVGDIRGRGLFRAMEFVEDKTTKQPFEPTLRLHARIKAIAM